MPDWEEKRPELGSKGDSADSTESLSPSTLSLLLHSFAHSTAFHPPSHARSIYNMKVFALVLLLVAPALATFSQGSLNLTRDWQLHYSKSVFSTSEAFCKSFRSKCVDYVGALGAHHQVSTPSGGVEKEGRWCGGQERHELIQILFTI